MVSTSPHRAALKKRTVRSLFLITLLIFLPLSLIGQVNAQVATQPGYSLIGTIRSGDFSGAVIIVAKGEQSFFRLFEKLPDGSQVVQVRDDSISLKGTDGTIYDMFISHEKTAGSVAPPTGADSPLNITSQAPATVLSNTGTGQPNARQRRRARHSSEEE
jgi:hypothetical protein